MNLLLLLNCTFTSEARRFGGKFEKIFHKIGLLRTNLTIENGYGEFFLKILWQNLGGPKDTLAPLVKFLEGPWPWPPWPPSSATPGYCHVVMFARKGYKSLTQPFINNILILNYPLIDSPPQTVSPLRFLPT